MTKLKKNKYYFQGMRFVPGYNDIDWDDCELEATSEAEAWKLLDVHTKMFTWRSVGLTHINGVKIEAAAV